MLVKCEKRVNAHDFEYLDSEKLYFAVQSESDWVHYKKYVLHCLRAKLNYKVNSLNNNPLFFIINLISDEYGNYSNTKM